MHRSKIPIQEWFLAAYFVSTHTPGISALQLKRQLGISSNDTAWYLLHRLRRGMVNDARTQLNGLIEADETFIEGPAKGKKGRGVALADNKSLVVGAVEVLVYQDKNGKRCERAGRLRLALISDASKKSLGDFISTNIAPSSRIRTDGWAGYSDTALEDYKHHVRLIKSMKLAHKKLPHIHRVFGNLKTWLNGTHHGVEPKYLPSYLNEYIFRFNRRNTPMAAFQTLLGISVKKSPLTLCSLAPMPLRATSGVDLSISAIASGTDKASPHVFERSKSRPKTSAQKYGAEIPIPSCVLREEILMVFAVYLSANRNWSWRYLM